MRKFIIAIKEVIDSAPVWFFMAHQDIVARYRRTTLGPWWITFGTGAALTGMAIVWSTLFNMQLKDLFPYIACGFVTWMFISATLTEAPAILCISGPSAKTIKISPLTFIFSSVLKNLYILLHNSVIILLVFLLFRLEFSLKVLLVIPGLALLILSAVFFSIIFSILGARFRDLGPIIGSLVTFIFLLTPIMWDMDILKGNALYLVYANPITHFIYLIRDPLLGKVPAPIFYYGAITITFVLAITSSYLYTKCERRLIYWI